MKRIITTLVQKWPEYIIESIVIVASILGAYALDSWNESTKNQGKKEALQRNLIAEFQNNLYHLNIAIDIHANSIVAGRKLLKLIADQENVSVSQGDSLLRKLYSGWTYDPRNGALRAAISSGDIHLLSNDSLVQLLFDWEDLVGDAVEDEHYTGNHLHHELNKPNPSIQWENILPEIFPDRTTSTSDYSTLLADSSFKYFVTIHIAYTFGAWQELQLVKDSNEKILQLLNETKE